MQSARFEELKASGQLPSPKGVALALMRLAQKPDVSQNEIVHVLKTDPALSGRVIKAANSAAFGRGRPVASLPDAVMVLGLRTVRQLALGFSLVNSYRTGECEHFDYHCFWLRSLFRAVAAPMLTLRLRVAQAEEMFMVGLLAGVGRLAMASLYPGEYSEVLRKVNGSPGPRLLEAERRAFATDHVELSAALLADWGFPKVLVEPVRHHEDPDSSGFPDGSRELMVSRGLHAASGLAKAYLAPDAERARLMPEALRLGTRVGIEPDAMASLCDRVVTEWREWSQLLELPAPDLPSLSEVNAAATRARSPEPSAPDSSTSRLRILVVDDDPAALLMLQDALASQGHTVFTARNGQEGIELALEIGPQLVISDWVMPGLDGASLCRNLRETRVGHSAYIVMMTTFRDEERIVEALEAGADECLAKPFTNRMLAARLRAAQRVIELQEGMRRDREEIRRFATELAVTNRRLQETALIDPLTELPNRRYALDRFEQEWSASDRTGHALACMIIDADGFKQINDSYGHLMGDAVLKHVAKTLRRGARAADVICRLGGEEFLVISPDTDIRAAANCAERLRRAVEAEPAQVGSVRLPMSVSVGVAARVPGMTRHEDLLKVADKAMYAAKRKGRNRVCIEAQCE